MCSLSLKQTLTVSKTRKDKVRTSVVKRWLASESTVRERNITNNNSFGKYETPPLIVGGTEILCR